MESGFQENTFVFLMIIGILIMLALALAFVLFFNFSKKKILTEQMRNQKLAYQHQEELLHSTILTQEAERKRIARELHDEIGSKLNVILLNTHRLRNLNPEKEEIGQITKEVNTLIHATIDTTRRISHNLLPPTLEEFGLVEAIKELRDTFQRSLLIKVNFELNEPAAIIQNKLIELNLYRILQELINNSIKHGEASSIKMSLWIKPLLIELKYEDNGKGFNEKEFTNKKGLGMKNIESRLGMIKGDIEINTSLGNGFRATIKVENRTE